MRSLSRRALMRSSLVAAFAGCLPELWGQGVLDPVVARAKSAGAAPQLHFIPEFLDELKLSRAYTLECAQAMPAEKYEFRPVPEVRTFGQQMVHISEAVPGLYELNEAFSVQALGVMRELGLDPAKVNVNGGAVAIGHPIGASGARLLVTLIYEMIRRNAHKGIAALCLGGGNSVAMAVER